LAQPSPAAGRSPRRRAQNQACKKLQQPWPTKAQGKRRFDARKRDNPLILLNKTNSARRTFNPSFAYG
jgi:hypothetical protein